MPTLGKRKFNNQALQGLGSGSPAMAGSWNLPIKTYPNGGPSSLQTRQNRSFYPRLAEMASICDWAWIFEGAFPDVPRKHLIKQQPLGEPGWPGPQNACWNPKYGLFFFSRGPLQVVFFLLVSLEKPQRGVPPKNTPILIWNLKQDPNSEDVDPNVSWMFPESLSPSYPLEQPQNLSTYWSLSW